MLHEFNKGFLAHIDIIVATFRYAIVSDDKDLLYVWQAIALIYLQPQMTCNNHRTEPWEHAAMDGDNIPFF